MATQATAVQTAPTVEDDVLTARTRATWTSGDFGRIARSYAPGAAAFIQRLNLRPGERVLDVATGTGNLAIPAAQTGADVTGLDIAPNLLAQAKQWARTEGLSVRLDEGNAEEMPYANGRFDVVVSMFGAMFAPRADAAAAELLRVTRPGGRIAMANWNPEGFIGQMFKIVGKHVPPPAGVPSPLQWGVEEIVAQRFGNQISDLRATLRTITFTFPFGPEATVDCFRNWYGPTVRAFDSLDAPGQAALHRELTDQWTLHNKAQNGTNPNDTTQVDSTYLEIVAIRK